MKALIEAAFKNVILDGGASQLQCEVMDNYGEGVTNEEFLRLPQKEITNDWAAVPEETLLYTAYLDDKGFRYYIPTFMISCLNRGDLVTETIFALDARPGDLWNYKMSQFSLLNLHQRSTIAQFLYSLPDLVEIRWHEDKVCIERAFTNYWHQYL